MGATVSGKRDAPQERAMSCEESRPAFSFPAAEGGPTRSGGTDGARRRRIPRERKSGSTASSRLARFRLRRTRLTARSGRCSSPNWATPGTAPMSVMTASRAARSVVAISQTKGPSGRFVEKIRVTDGSRLSRATTDRRSPARTCSVMKARTAAVSTSARKPHGEPEQHPAGDELVDAVLDRTTGDAPSPLGEARHGRAGVRAKARDQRAIEVVEGFHRGSLAEMRACDWRFARCIQRCWHISDYLLSLSGHIFGSGAARRTSPRGWRRDMVKPAGGRARSPAPRFRSSASRWRPAPACAAARWAPPPTARRASSRRCASSATPSATRGTSPSRARSAVRRR